ncbi:hypothetical protein ACXITP_00800 [Actinotignum sanguinis]|uniref:Uncharacterized protein n=2 Tax=Actinomycetaceae TaxID=2049 RepID=A0ABZ0RC10_9ACTO|nr:MULTISPECIES: hypothetical protein [Actinotignum]WPJ88590.1 hypothetical protein R0V15_06900 [Schaalia turicensis]MDE1553028.1 hypothetical protein [Actinotignum sanguinis]MDE1565929.1 hypothetical protein [Actinotignum sanguinis]MDE1577515.1 hypothetical protein [Actinotignum sanguinis]MDE1641681.1 hypothetical protein [Actinotignum sanguinis]
MGVFSLRGGQFHRAAPPADLPEETRTAVAEALRAQISDFLDFPAFQVAWTRPEGERGTASLVALDATGNIISVDIIDVLDGAALLAALARSAQHATLDRREITRLFPGGPHDFSSAWQEFTAVNPPIPEPAPRLSIFAFAIEPDTYDAVRALAGAGVQVWQVTILERATGILLSVDEIRLQRATALGPAVGVPLLDVAPEAEASEAAEAEATEKTAAVEVTEELEAKPEPAVKVTETPAAAERPRRRGSRAAQPGTESTARSRNIWQEIRGRRAAHTFAATATSGRSSAHRASHSSTASPAHTAAEGSAHTAAESPAHRAANPALHEGSQRSDYQAAPRRRARRAAE